MDYAIAMKERNECRINVKGRTDRNERLNIEVEERGTEDDFKFLA